jgi:transposase InsO family protein
MKDSYPPISLARICRLLGITRQAYYQHFWTAQDHSIEHQLILDEVRKIRLQHPVMGGRKLFCLLQDFLMDHQIKMGRDALFDLLATHRLLVRRRKGKVNTTQSRHWYKKYSNLIKNWHPSEPQQLWVSDITYVPYQKGFLYLSLVTDAYSHKVVGYCIAETLEALHTTNALKMALTHLKKPYNLIHHSDRGLQYCCYNYVNLLNDHDIQISMTESGDPLENPIAERINGIIKNEYLKHYAINSPTEAQFLLKEAITKYNEQRPHQSIKMLTPEIVHEHRILVNKKWGKNQVINNIVNL